jgi:LPXTG-motif cell wall-anchored protein
MAQLMGKVVQSRNPILRRDLIMKSLFIPMVLLLALSVPALAEDDGGGWHGAPGPLMGAGLPVLLIGGGIYWIVRRKKKRA